MALGVNQLATNQLGDIKPQLELLSSILTPAILFIMASIAPSVLNLLARTSLVGNILFVLPPIGRLPPLWQVVAAYLAWIVWSYRFGIFARCQLTMAAAESVASVWLSLKWTQLLVAASTLAVKS